MALAEISPPDPVGAGTLVVTSLVIFVGAAVAAWVGYRPLLAVIRDQERMYERVLQGTLLLDIEPRMATMMTGVLIVVLAVLGYAATDSALGLIAGVAVGVLVPPLVLRLLRRRRLMKLEEQLVGGIQTLASGVRAGLNLVQSLELVGRDGPVPLKQEFVHLLKEYEYGVSLEKAMDNAAERIGSTDFRLLFTALQTHRERGGDLGETLDRIAESIREIQRLEARVKALTAQGRATSRWLGAMPIVVMVILYFIDSMGVEGMIADGLGKLILAGIVFLNIIGFLWIRKIVAVDI